MGHKGRKFTQANKPHKDKSKPSSAIKKPKNGKKTKAVNNSKDLRVHQAKQQRENSIKENNQSERGNNTNAPLLCGVFPLFHCEHIEVILSLLKSSDPESIIKKIDNIPNYSKLNCESLIMKSKKLKKNFAFASCKDFKDRFDYLDLAKVVDWCLFILPDDLDELIGDYTEDLFSSLIAQGMPSGCFITLKSDKSFKMKDDIKYLESIIKIPLADSKIHCLSNSNDANKLMRHLAQNCKPHYSASKKSNVSKTSIKEKRGYFLAQNIKYEEDNMRLTGCMRGFGIDLEKSEFIHLTGVGDFSIKEVSWISPEESNHFTEKDKVQSLKNFVFKHEEINNEASDNDHESDEEMKCSGSEDDAHDSSEDSEMEEVSDIGSIDSDNDPMDEKMSFATTAHSGFSVAQIMKFKKSREESMFPDEVEVPYNEKAKEKFSKYRGMLGFKSTQWPIQANLPKCYEKISFFKNYKHERNRLCNMIDKTVREHNANFILPGSVFEMVLEKVSPSDIEKLQNIIRMNPGRHLIGSGLFVKEDKLSVLHFNEKRIAAVDDSVINKLAKLSPSTDSAIALGEEATSHYDVIDENYQLKPAAEPIESKETMLFQLGFRRFSSTPIYSELTAASDQPGDKGKSKFLNFMELNKHVVVSTYGPITFGPVNVLQFRIRQQDESADRAYVSELVASGSLLSIDPTKPIIKRIRLTGQIYKVNKRSAMIRYMFFNTEDIEHFKDVRLHAPGNILGRILEPHGSHGYMKCHFDKKVSQNVIPYMPLYKRVFPKFTVENMYDNFPNVEQAEMEDEAMSNVMDTLF